MRAWWILLITIHLVWGNQECFEKQNENSVTASTNEVSLTEDGDNFKINCDTKITYKKRKRSPEEEERAKKNQKFHAWGGKRYGDEDDDEIEENDDPEENINSYESNYENTLALIPLYMSSNLTNTKIDAVDEKPPSIKRTNQSPAFSSWAGKRDPEVLNDVGKRSSIYTYSFQPDILGSGKPEQSIKRYPTFSSWAGKRAAAFNGLEMGTRDSETIKDNLNINPDIISTDLSSRSYSDEDSDASNSDNTNNSNDSFDELPGPTNEIINSKKAAAFISWGGKRQPAFNSWAGKRAAAFNSWGGKRTPAFNSWSGKRGSAFNSWGGKRVSNFVNQKNSDFNSGTGKRNAAFNSWGGKRTSAFNSWGGKRAAAFNSWGGKRAAAFNSWGGKRAAAFNSWGGKRAAAFNSWGGKRAPQFNSWAGKRSAAFNSWGGKRSGAFNSWDENSAAAFNNWDGKRAAAFNSWGGKRTVDGMNENYIDYPTWTKTRYDMNNHHEHLNPDYVAIQENYDIPYQSYLIRPMYDQELFDLNEKNDKLALNSEMLGNYDTYTDKRENKTYDTQKEDNKLFETHTTYPNTLDQAQKRNKGNQLEKKEKPSFSSWAGKRNPLFSSWYGSKAPVVQLSSGKRRPAFSSWGGKRSEHQESLKENSGDCTKNSLSNDKTCLKPPEIYLEENDSSLNSAEDKIYARRKRELNCKADGNDTEKEKVTNACSGKKSERDEKKNRVFTRMLLQGSLTWPMAFKSLPRSLNFYAWGGKRSL